MSSLENRTRFQTKMGKVYAWFKTKTEQKFYPLGEYPRGVSCGRPVVVKQPKHSRRLACKMETFNT